METARLPVEGKWPGKLSRFTSVRFAHSWAQAHHEEWSGQMFKFTRYRVGLFIGLTLLLVFPLANSFASPTGFDVDPEFQSFYEQSGELPVFGYAVSAPGEEDGRLVQYFERQRFELHPEHAGTPYIVLLGHLGHQDAERRGLKNHEAFQPRASGNGEGEFFPQTGHNLSGLFRDYWHSQGLNFGDSGVSFRESLALFGYPISEEFVDPDTGLVTQYFERARFEHHPEHAGTEYEVLLGHLGHSEIDFLRANGRGPSGEGPPGQQGRGNNNDQEENEPAPEPDPTPAPAPEPDNGSGDNDVAPGTSIQQMVDNASPGATVRVPAGIYRETVTINKPITLIGEPGAEIRGDNESGNVVREYWIVGRSDNVTIEGFTMRYASNQPQTGALNDGGHNNWIVRNSIFSHAAGANVSLTGDNAQLLDSDISHGGQLGVHSGGGWDFNRNEITNPVRNLVVRGNRIYNNNTDGHDSGWEAGGLKATVQDGSVFENNEVFNNDGPGLWCDIDCRDVTFENNRLHNNSGPGISYELSFNGTIRNNIVWENGYSWDHWGWGAGILIQNSSDTTASDNVVAWNYSGISVVSQDRGLSRWNNVSGNTVRSNQIFSVATHDFHNFALAWLEDWNGVIGANGSNNQGADNRYFHHNADRAWMVFSAPSGDEFGFNQLDQFNRTSGENNGQHLSGADRDRILGQHGVPTQPTRSR
jgi:parallel beta-helix repeat protein